MKWIKTSERMPNKIGLRYHVKLENNINSVVILGWRDKKAGTKGFYKCDVADWNNYPSKVIEWLDESDQPAPIPADITKWIEENYSFLAIDYFKDENKHEVVFDLGWMRIFKGGMITMYNLLQSKMQEQENKIEFYRETTSRVREFVSKNQDIGKPCQPLYEAIVDEIQSLQSQLAEAKQEIEKLNDIVRNRDECIMELEKRCGEYAEELLDLKGGTPF